MTPAAKRQAVAHACAVHGVSERRACRILGVDRASMRYRSRRPGETDVRLRIRALAHRRRRFGYRRTVRKRQRRTHAHGSFASAALAHLQFLFTVKPPKAFVVHAPSLPSQQHMPTKQLLEPKNPQDSKIGVCPICTVAAWITNPENEGKNVPAVG